MSVKIVKVSRSGLLAEVREISGDVIVSLLESTEAVEPPEPRVEKEAMEKPESESLQLKEGASHTELISDRVTHGMKVVGDKNERKTLTEEGLPVRFTVGSEEALEKNGASKDEWLGGQLVDTCTESSNSNSQQEKSMDTDTGENQQQELGDVGSDGSHRNCRIEPLKFFTVLEDNEISEHTDQKSAKLFKTLIKSTGVQKKAVEAAMKRKKGVIKICHNPKAYLYHLKYAETKVHENRSVHQENTAHGDPKSKKLRRNSLKDNARKQEEKEKKHRSNTEKDLNGKFQPGNKSGGKTAVPSSYYSSADYVYYSDRSSDWLKDSTYKRKSYASSTVKNGLEIGMLPPKFPKLMETSLSCYSESYESGDHKQPSVSTSTSFTTIEDPLFQISALHQSGGIDLEKIQEYIHLENQNRQTNCEQTEVPTPVHSNIPVPVTNSSTPKDIDNSMCSVSCPGLIGVPPPLQCSQCLCCYHAECLGSHLKDCNFLCASCKGTQSAWSFLAEKSSSVLVKPLTTKKIRASPPIKLLTSPVSCINPDTEECTFTSNSTSVLVDKVRTRDTVQMGSEHRGTGLPLEVIKNQIRKMQHVTKQIASHSQIHHPPSTNNNFAVENSFSIELLPNELTITPIPSKPEPGRTTGSQDTPVVVEDIGTHVGAQAIVPTGEFKIPALPPSQPQRRDQLKSLSSIRRDLFKPVPAIRHEQFKPLYLFRRDQIHLLPPPPQYSVPSNLQLRSKSPFVSPHCNVTIIGVNKFKDMQRSSSTVSNSNSANNKAPITKTAKVELPKEKSGTIKIPIMKNPNSQLDMKKLYGNQQPKREIPALISGTKTSQLYFNVDVQSKS